MDLADPIKQEELMKARTERAIRLIESFAVPTEPKRLPFTRRNALEWIKLHWGALRSATTEELCDVIALLERLEARK